MVGFAVMVKGYVYIGDERPAINSTCTMEMASLFLFA